MYVITHKYKLRRVESGTFLVSVKTLETIEQNPRITPAEISEKTGITIQYIRNTLATLVELKLVVTPVRGIYVITNLGKYVLNYLQKELDIKKNI
ncbi:hypothetical protein ES703_119899 [subsurface metagenome]